LHSVIPQMSFNINKDGYSSRMLVTKHLKQPTRTIQVENTLVNFIAKAYKLSLFGLAPGGVYPAIFVTKDAVRSYRTISPLPRKLGGIFSVALSLRLPSADVIRHLILVEPGLSSLYQTDTQQPSDNLTSLKISLFNFYYKCNLSIFKKIPALIFR
jgi:hypothetical protein